MKLVMDLAGGMPLRGHMDDDRRDLAIRLCTEAGMLMEDMSIIALAARGGEIPIRARIDQLAAAIDDMAVLIAAAGVVVGRGG